MRIFHWSLFSTCRSPLAWSSQEPDSSFMPISYFNCLPAMMDNLFSPGISLRWGSSCLNSISRVTFGWHSILTSRQADLPSVLRSQSSSAWQPSLWIYPVSCDWAGMPSFYQKTKYPFRLEIYGKIRGFFFPPTHEKWDGQHYKFRDKAWNLYSTVCSGKTPIRVSELGVLPK